MQKSGGTERGHRWMLRKDRRSRRAAALFEATRTTVKVSWNGVPQTRMIALAEATARAYLR